MYEITIGKPYTTIEDNNTISLNSDILINNKKEKIFFKLDKKYKPYLVTENIDAFVIAILPFALEKGCTIKSDGKITKRLLYQLRQYFIPCLLSCKENTKNVNFEIKTIEEEIESKNKVATIYPGRNEIDNLFTIYENQMQNVNTFKLTHLIKINNVYFENKILQPNAIDKICNNLNIEIINLETNLIKEYKEKRCNAYIYIYTAAVYSIKKLFNTLLVASTYPISEFSFSDDAASYELLIANSLSLPNLMIHSSGGAYNRNRKIEILKNDSKFQKYIK